MVADVLTDKSKGSFNLNSIIDAAGKYHDLSKGAFDTFGIKNLGNFDPGFGKLLQGSFSEGLTQILSEHGVRTSTLKLFQNTESGFGTTFGEFAAKEAVAAGAGSAFGPIGAVFGAAIELGDAVRSFWQGPRGWSTTDTLGRGQWIAVDNGKKKARSSSSTPGSFATSLFGDSLSSEDRVLEEGLQNISLGFYIGPGARQGDVQVFNFETWRDEDRMRKFVLPLPRDFAAKMDNNELLSEVRLLRFAEEPKAKLYSNICTDSGAEVVYEGEFYQVLESRGSQIFIENKSKGQLQYWVNILDLQPGRRQHSTSWNYRGEGEVQPGEPSFDGGEKAAFVSGDWLWVKPSRRTLAGGYSGCKRQLAVMENLDGNHINYYMAVDGEAGRDNFPTRHVRPVSTDVNEFLYLSGPCQIFRDAAVCGQDTSRLAVGKDRRLTLLCLGITNDVPVAEKKYGEFEYHDFGETEGEGEQITFQGVGSGSAEGYTAGEFKGAAPGEKKQAGGAPDTKKNAAQTLEENAGVLTIRLDSPLQSEQTETPEASNQSLLIAGGVVVVAVGLYFVLKR